MLSYTHQALADKANPDAGSLLKPVGANQNYAFIKIIIGIEGEHDGETHSSLGGSSTLLSRRVKIEHDF